MSWVECVFSAFLYFALSESWRLGRTLLGGYLFVRIQAVEEVLLWNERYSHRGYIFVDFHDVEHFFFWEVGGVIRRIIYHWQRDQ